jgi:FkbM family methyltransferase
VEVAMREILTAVRKILPQSVRDAVNKAVYYIRNMRFKPYLKRKNVEGVVFDFWIGDMDGRDWYDLHCSDPVWTEMRFIRDYLIRPGDVAFDCGAHHGCTTIVLSSWVGNSGQVVAFEPLPRNCKIIQRNIEINGLKNVVLEEKAVGTERGRIRVSCLSNSSVMLSGKGVEVEATRLDDYEHLNPTFLKVDVEGFEVQVLRGAQKILSRRPKLAIEIHTEHLPKYQSSVEDLFRLIDAGRYKLWIQWDDGTEPEEYNMKRPITKRVHLFGIPVGPCRVGPK